VTDIAEPPRPDSDERRWRMVAGYIAEQMMLLDGYATVERTRLGRQADAAGRVTFDVNRLSVPERPPYVIGGPVIGDGPWIELILHVAHGAEDGVIGGIAWTAFCAALKPVVARRKRIMNVLKERLPFRSGKPWVTEELAIQAARMAIGLYTAKVLKGKVDPDALVFDGASLSSGPDGPDWHVSFHEKKRKAPSQLRSMYPDGVGLVFEATVPGNPKTWAEFQIRVRVREVLIDLRALTIGGEWRAGVSRRWPGPRRSGAAGRWRRRARTRIAWPR
jgi:hypothetical protein